jgi:hypothetical protein
MSFGALWEYLELWDTGIPFLRESPAGHPRTKIGISGDYLHQDSTQIILPMMLSFRAPSCLSLVNGFGNLGPLPNVIFFMWLVAHNRCWTADRLEKRGLPHPARCPLCDQVDENLQHLLIKCVFARQLWFSILQHTRGVCFGLFPASVRQKLLQTAKHPAFQLAFVRIVLVKTPKINVNIESIESSQK